MTPIIKVRRVAALGLVTAASGAAAHLLPIPPASPPAPDMVAPATIQAGSSIQTPTIVAAGLVRPSAIAAASRVEALSLVTGAVAVAPGSLANGAAVAAPSLTAPGGAIVAPGAISAGSSVRAPAVAPGAAWIIVPAPSPSSIIYAPSISQVGVSQIAPAAIPSSSAALSPSVQPGAVTASPTRIEAASLVQAPVLAAGAIAVAPPAIGPASTVPAAAVAVAGVSVAPVVVASTASVPSHALAVGAVAVAPQVVASGASVAAPQIAVGDVATAPATISTTAVVPAPVVQPEQQQPQAISAVNADGWSAEWASGTPPTFAPDTSPQTISVNRAGFDATGAATTISDTLTFLTRVSQPYNNYGTPTPTTVALSDYIYAGDAIAGVNTSAIADASPKPVCGWSRPHRLRVGNTIGGSTIPIAFVAHHRDARQGKPIAAAKFILTDSQGASKTITVPAPVVTLKSGAPAIIEYELPATDISDLAAGIIRVNGEAYPHLGTGAAVAKSASDGNPARGFAPRYFLKTSTPATYVYVSSSGSDSTGVASQDASTALATPCLTVMGALAKGVVAAGVADHVVIRVLNTVAMGSNSTAKAQNVAAAVVENAPSVSTANAIVQISAAGVPALTSGLTIPTAEGGLLFRGVTIRRTANVLFSGNSTIKLEVQLVDCAFDHTSVTGAWLSNASDAHFGTSYANLASTSLAETASAQRRIFRHCTFPDLLGTGTIHSQLVIGCDINRASNYGTLTSGAFFSFNRVSRMSNSITFGATAGTTLVGFMLVQNVLEFTSATANPVIRISADSGTDNTDHVCCHNNTIAGAARAGRRNGFYDETPGGVRRTHKRASDKGNIWVSDFIKSSQFLGSNGNGSPDPTNAPTATGNWPLLHGVGVAGDVILYQAATPLGGSEAPLAVGLNSSSGVQQFAPTQLEADMFVTPAGTTVTSGGAYTAGAGGGDYRLKAGAIAKSRLASALLPYDLAGNARPLTNDSAGAYA